MLGIICGKEKNGLYSGFPLLVHFHLWKESRYAMVAEFASFWLQTVTPRHHHHRVEGLLACTL